MTDTAFQASWAIWGILGCFLLILIPGFFILSLVLAIVRKSKGWAITTVIFGLLSLALIGIAIFGVFFSLRDEGEGRRIRAQGDLMAIASALTIRTRGSLSAMPQRSTSVG